MFLKLHSTPLLNLIGYDFDLDSAFECYAMPIGGKGVQVITKQSGVVISDRVFPDTLILKHVLAGDVIGLTLEAATNEYHPGHVATVYYPNGDSDDASSIGKD